jgi:hypothetical protein
LAHYFHTHCKINLPIMKKITFIYTLMFFASISLFANNHLEPTSPSLTNNDILSYYSDPDDDCENGIMLTLNMFDSYGDGWNGNVLALGDQHFTMEHGSHEQVSVCLDYNTNCIQISCDGGSWPSEVSWSLVDEEHTTILSGGAPCSYTLGECSHYGCTDEIADNYNESATTDDGSCTYVEGCTDPIAVNYNPSATLGDGSCLFETECDGPSVIISMFDTFGDGWNGNVLHIGHQQFELEEGSHEEVVACLDFDAECYNITCGGGLWENEVSWSINDAFGNPLLTGHSPFEGQIGACQDDTDGGDNETCLTLDYDYTNTGSNMTLILPYAALDFVEEIGEGDMGVFYLNENQEYISAGSIYMDGEETAFPAMGDDHTTEYVDGISEGESLTWIYTTPVGDQYFLTSYPQQAYSVNALYYIESFGYELINCANDVMGCMDSIANNFNPEATIDDASCTFDVYGCTDELATNYDSAATEDDGSCTYDIYGCTDQTANNYDVSATVDDQSCDYEVTGCTDSEALNYNPDATQEDDSCYYNGDECGCTDPNYTEYYTQGFEATCSNNSCSTSITSAGLVSGNFVNPLNTAVNMTLGMQWDGIFIPEGSMVAAFSDLNGDGLINNMPMVNSMNQVYYECVGISDYSTEFFTMALWGDDTFSEEIDGLPVGTENIIFALLTPNQTVVAFDFNDSQVTFVPNGLVSVNTINLNPTIYGCTDPSFCNYNMYATEDDGSCYGYFGCTEQMYMEYDAEATCHSQEMCHMTWHESYVDMEGQMDSVVSTMEQMEEQMGDAYQTIDSMIVMVNGCNDMYNEMTDAYYTSESENTSLITTITTMEGLMNNANNTIDSMMVVVDDMVVMYDDMTEQYNSSVSENDVLNTTITAMEDDMQDASTTIDSMMVVVDDMTEAYNESEAERILLMSSLNSMEVQMNETTTVLDSMALMVDQLTTANEELASSGGAPISIDLIDGWNIIGYSLNEAQDAAACFNSVVDQLSIVKNNAGEVYWPSFGFNGIGNLLPGQGYQVRMDEPYSNFVFENVNGQRIDLQPTVPQWALDMNIPNHPNDVKSLVKVVNTLGQEVNPDFELRGTVLFYLYNDGTVEKLMVK